MLASVSARPARRRAQWLERSPVNQLVASDHNAAGAYSKQAIAGRNYCGGRFQKWIISAGCLPLPRGRYGGYSGFGLVNPACKAALVVSGINLAPAVCRLFLIEPATTWSLPAISASKPSLATSAGSSFGAS